MANKGTQIGTIVPGTIVPIRTMVCYSHFWLGPGLPLPGSSVMQFVHRDANGAAISRLVNFRNK
ncbi:hypothetical protein ACVWZK_009494 [Bradyrhizobium sp. GM0.4]|uniref:hypothetical protein n=1 Tax=unclassified Bradyrhizobium TaxID=2631580 RepID=UPI001FF93E79|nr:MULTISPECIES: hypothetical protein [unclassified Bradyrhizobium]MCK1349212.1 hypothetical protein [Bradyrhizobium sp. CW11]MCK1587888.1 hypothetical protein [Bradyrhizobium sp. 169]